MFYVCQLCHLHTLVFDVPFITDRDKTIPDNSHYPWHLDPFIDDAREISNPVCSNRTTKLMNLSRQLCTRYIVQELSNLMFLCICGEYVYRRA